MVLKKHHASAILEYVTLANKERGGMVTVGRIQAYLISKFDKVFKKATIYYCLTKRLNLRYSDSGKAKIAFTPARRRATMIYCKDFDAALKLQAAGTHIIVYMDESYCHVNHRGARTWWKPGNTAQRGRGKGSLLILIHAITKDGFLCGTDPDGIRHPVDEWETGTHPTTEMVFRSKYAVKHRVKDYHDTMDGEFFMYWVEKRLTPAFEAKYPGKTMILCLDNAPYHHTLVEDGFRPGNMSKEAIVERLRTLPRKAGVRKLKRITVKPYADQPPPPPLPCIQTPEAWAGFVFLDNGGEVWLIDGIDDQGFGDVVVYSRVGSKKGGAVESTSVEVFLQRLQCESHAQRFYMIGHGEQAVRFVRGENLLVNNKVPRRLRATRDDIVRLRERARQYCDREKEVTYSYNLRDFMKRYNGGGFRGTGGPKTEWLRHSVH